MSRGAASDYIQRYMTEHPENSWEQLKSELNVRFAEINVPHHSFAMLHKARQVKNECTGLCREAVYFAK